jgi:hypothetical protein
MQYKQFAPFGHHVTYLAIVGISAVCTISLLSTDTGESTEYVIQAIDRVGKLYSYAWSGCSFCPRSASMTSMNFIRGFQAMTNFSALSYPVINTL